MEQAPQVDNRMDFLGVFVQKTLKLKPEKWSRMMATEEHKALVMKFLERPFPILLVIILTPTAQLVASNSFPLTQLKSKGIFFVKRGLVPVCKVRPYETVIIGDLSCKIIDQLASLVDEVLVPILSNSQNHAKWPTVIAKDVQKHVHSLKSTVYQVKGQVNGQTVLPMPVGVEKVHEVEKILIESNGEICDLYLKSAIEGVVIKWATQINEVLLNDSSEATSGPNPIPTAELQFWGLRLRNLQYIYEQLKEPRVRSMAIILEKTNSAYYSCFKNLFKNTVMALAEAKDISIHLKPLKKYIRQLQETEFSDCIAILPLLIHVVCLIWYNSKCYDQMKIIVLFKQICNLLIQEAKKFLDPTTLFHSDIDEAMFRVQISIKVLKKFVSFFMLYKDKLLVAMAGGRQPVLWTFHPNTVFERLYAFIDRLNTIQWFFNTILEFTKLEKVEIGGFKGRILSSKVVAVYGEFQQCFQVFSGKSYDVLDPDDNSFLADFEGFKQKIFEMDLKLASILCQAFEDCSNLDSIFKLINIVGSVLDRQVINQEFTNKYNKIIVMLNEEVQIAEVTF